LTIFAAVANVSPARNAVVRLNLPLKDTNQCSTYGDAEKICVMLSEITIAVRLSTMMKSSPEPEGGSKAS
jgi:hypothetical protein